MALGFQLLGSKATVCAQVKQINSEKVAATKTEVKKEKETRKKVEKAESLFELFKSGLNMLAKAWQDIVKFLVPLYHKKSASVKFNLVNKAKGKLGSFVKEYGST